MSSHQYANVDFDAVVVGSGPNGLAAAITLQRAGARVLLLEARNELGGGMRTAELTLPGFLHDVCSAVHPMAAASPFMQGVPLRDYGLQLIQPPVACAHPLDDGTAATLVQSMEETTASLDEPDARTYREVFAPLVQAWPQLAPDVLGPLGMPRHPVEMASFGLRALRSATGFASRFKGERARALFAGMAAHSFLPLTAPTSAAAGMVLAVVGHVAGWPVARGGSASIARALAAYFTALGGTIQTGTEVRSLEQLPAARAVLFDVGPTQLLRIAGHSLSSLYRWQLSRYRYGMGVFKIDWALSQPAPFTAQACRHAGTVHLGGTLSEVALSEHEGNQGRHADRPFVLFAQQSVFDPGRVPPGAQAAWGYCHVPNGSTVDMTERIERQVERFAPGFRNTILARRTWNTHDMEAHNPNNIGGDINGGRIDLTQLFTRPTLRRSPYRTSNTQLYLCSASTPPGGGVHGMCGYNAAQRVLKDHFRDLLHR